MAEQHQVYKCAVCGIVVEVLRSGGGELVCCGAPMELRIEKTEDEGHEKHVPVIEKVGGTVIIKVGEIPHPMTVEHYIEWIEVNVDGRICKKFLNPGDAPEAEFHVSGENVQARIHCNIHGLWRDK